MSLKKQNSSSRSAAKIDFSRAIALISEQSSGRDNLIIQLLYSTGITPSELVSAKVKDISARNALVIPAQNTKHNTARSIALSSVLTRKLLKQCAGKNADDFIFSTRQSPQLTTRRVEQIVKDACLQAGLAQVLTARDFRRNFLATAAAHAKNDGELKRVTGLKSISKKKLLKDKEEQRLNETLRAAPARDRLLIELLRTTSIRLSEALQLHKKDLDDESITLPDRTIPISSSLSFKLKQFTSQDDDFIFSTRQSPQLTVRRAEQIIAAWGRTAGLELTSHTLRTTAIHRLATQFGIEEAQRIAGLKTTLTYTHALVQQKRSDGGAP